MPDLRVSLLVRLLSSGVALILVATTIVLRSSGDAADPAGTNPGWTDSSDDLPPIDGLSPALPLVNRLVIAPPSAARYEHPCARPLFHRMVARVEYPRAPPRCA